MTGRRVVTCRGSGAGVARTAGTMVLGSLVIYAFGLPWLMGTLRVGLARGPTLGATPFLTGDAVKVVLAAGLLPASWRLVRRD